jgi:hypothetical protein
MTDPEINPVQPDFPPFFVMVNKLFKGTPDHTYQVQFGNLVHAAIGIVGETIELRFADSETNMMEELGDLEFYIEAAIQQVEQLVPEFIDVYSDTNRFSEMVLSTHTNTEEVKDLMLLSANVFLDVSKKLWVYNKPLDEGLIVKLVTALGNVKGTVRKYEDLVGYTWGYIQNLNQEKLIGVNGRYKSGFYSDAAAQAREDKVAEEADTAPSPIIPPTLDSPRVTSDIKTDMHLEGDNEGSDHD